MMTTKTRAVVLRTVRYGDSGLVVDMLTEQMGRISFMVKLPRSSKSRIHKQLFMPLSLVEVDFDFRPKASLQRLRDIRMDTPLPGLAMHPHKLALGMFLAEFLASWEPPTVIVRSAYSSITTTMYGIYLWPFVGSR